MQIIKGFEGSTGIGASQMQNKQFEGSTRIGASHMQIKEFEGSKDRCQPEANKGNLKDLRIGGSQIQHRLV